MVFCPTRDRPSQLSKTLQALTSDYSYGSGLSISLTVIDDSVQLQHSERNRYIVEQVCEFETAYHGKLEQQEFLDNLVNVAGIPRDNLLEFIRPLGHTAWDLGAIRNYISWLALCLPEKNNFVIIFMDDDIELVLPQSVRNDATQQSSLVSLCRLVVQNPENIYGGVLVGLEDMSRVERAILECRKDFDLPKFIPASSPVPISGGLMAFSKHCLKERPFPRVYNEDWIWLIGCRLLGAKLVRTEARAVHAWSPFKPILESEMHREQFGEVFCEGWAEAYSLWLDENIIEKNLGEPSYWEYILKEEKQYLFSKKEELLEDMERSTKNCKAKLLDHKGAKVLEKTLLIMDVLRPEELALFAMQYIKSFHMWRTIAKKMGECLTCPRSSQ